MTYNFNEAADIIDEAIEIDAYNHVEVEIITAQLNSMNQMTLSCEYC